LPFYGLAVVCIEDPEIQRILPDIQRPVLTYGFHKDANYRAENWTQNVLSSEFTVYRPAPHAPLNIQFRLPGLHNVLNALASIAIATELGVDDASIVRALSNFQGVGRRFQMLGERQFANGKALVVDDYGHHPQEIRATLDAFRAVWPDSRLVHVFQPHRYTRTQSLFSEFVNVLQMADELLLLDIYSAGEPPISGVTSDVLAQEIHQHSSRVTRVTELNLDEYLNKLVRDGDVILMQGAGSVGTMALNLMQAPRDDVRAVITTNGKRTLV
jgi:UDP-N-acetylmuramate--alanine ligase